MVSLLALVLIVGGALANSLYNLFAAKAGWGYPYVSYLFFPRDRYADFFKLSWSYPGPPTHSVAAFWGADTLLANLRQSLELLQAKQPQMNHFHVPPLPTLAALGWRRAMVAWDPMLVFSVLSWAGMGTLAWLVAMQSPRGSDRLLLAIAALYSYPVRFMADRGHLFSLACAIALIAALLRTVRRGRSDLVSIMLFAVALNFRPNAAVFPLLLFLGKRGMTLRDMVMLGVVATLLFAAALLADHAIYPAYDLAAFRHGLGDYAHSYVEDLGGVAFGSSLYGALAVLFGMSAWTFGLPLAVAGVIFAGSALAARRDRIGGAELVYLGSAAYTLGSQVVADYHLMVFLAPLALLARRSEISARSEWMVFLGSCLILLPKNYVFLGSSADGSPLSWQIVINPLILLVTSTVILRDAFAGRRSEAPVESMLAA